MTHGRFQAVALELVGHARTDDPPVDSMRRGQQPRHEGGPQQQHGRLLCNLLSALRQQLEPRRARGQPVSRRVRVQLCSFQRQGFIVHHRLYESSHLFQERQDSFLLHERAVVRVGQQL